MVFTCVLVVSNLASLVCAQAGCSRLLFVMARDNRIPKRFFGYLSPRFRTPTLTIGLMGIVMLLGELLDVDVATSCVNFGAFSAFLAVNVCAVADRIAEKGPLRVGIIPIVMACAGAAAAIWLIFSLSRLALTVGLVWLLVGLCYVVYQRRRGVAAGLAPVS